MGKDRYQTVRVLIAPDDRFGTKVPIMPTTWVYCEGGPRRGMRLGECPSCDCVVFTGNAARYYYRITERRRWTNTLGAIPVAVFDRVEGPVSD